MIQGQLEAKIRIIDFSVGNTYVTLKYMKETHSDTFLKQNILHKFPHPSTFMNGSAGCYLSQELGLGV